MNYVFYDSNLAARFAFSKDPNMASSNTNKIKFAFHTACDSSYYYVSADYLGPYDDWEEGTFDYGYYSEFFKDLKCDDEGVNEFTGWRASARESWITALRYAQLSDVDVYSIPRGGCFVENILGVYTQVIPGITDQVGVITEDVTVAAMKYLCNDFDYEWDVSDVYGSYHYCSGFTPNGAYYQRHDK